MLDEGDWHTHLSITGHVGQMREDTDLTGIDRLAWQYIGMPYPRFDCGRISALDRRGRLARLGALKDGSQPG